MVDVRESDLQTDGRRIKPLEAEAGNLSEIRNTLRDIESWLGHSLPDDYLVFDLETTGFKRDFDLPVCFGWCLVRDREDVSNGELVLNWYKYPELVEPEWLDSQLYRVQWGMESAGSRWLYTPEYLREHGLDPLRVLFRAQKLFQENRAAGCGFLGHNAWNFDCQMLNNVFCEYLGHLGDTFEFVGDEVFDSGGLVKAAATGIKPTPEDKTVADYFNRVHHTKVPGYRWALSVLAERYGLFEESGLSREDAHTAKADAYLCYMLFELVRRGLPELPKEVGGG
jgi:DNA polymerase III epsilon subunit-like protein